MPHALPHPSHNLNNLETVEGWVGREEPLQPSQSPLLVRLLLGRQLLVTLTCMLFGHGPLSPSWAPKGHGVGGGGRSHTGQSPAGLSPPTTGPTGTPVDLCEQAGTGCILLIVFQEQAACLLVEGRLRVGVDQQALDGLWGMGTGSEASKPWPHKPPISNPMAIPFLNAVTLDWTQLMGTFLSHLCSSLAQ